jgi:hypothetical protein
VECHRQAVSGTFQPNVRGVFPARSTSSIAGPHVDLAIDAAAVPIGQLRIRSGAAQADRLVEWAAAWPGRIWAVEGAAGLGHLLA